ncbi:hypothetical protein Droror1_Dr00021681 [Drosera rotundifolia]
MVAEVSSEVCDFYHQCNYRNYFSVSFLELEEMGYESLIVANEILVRAPDGFPGSIVLSYGSCSLKIRFLISADVRVPLRSPNLEPWNEKGSFGTMTVEVFMSLLRMGCFQRFLQEVQYDIDSEIVMQLMMKGDVAALLFRGFCHKCQWRSPFEAIPQALRTSPR